MKIKYQMNLNLGDWWLSPEGEPKEISNAKKKKRRLKTEERMLKAGG